MTMIETAKANGLDPVQYLEDLLQKVSELPTFAKNEQLEACLPWNIVHIPSAIHKTQRNKAEPHNLKKRDCGALTYGWLLGAYTPPT